jgi:hypothetical protein
MTILRWHLPAALLLPLLTLGGCYTQFGSSDDESTLDYVSSEGEDARGIADGDYYSAREKFYADAYYPGYTLGVGMGFGAFEWGWSYPYVPYPSGYTYGGGHGTNNHSGTVVRPRGATRGFGSERTAGSSRMPESTVIPGAPGFVPLPVGVRQAGGSSAGSPARPGYTGGRRGTEATRIAPVTTPAPKGQSSDGKGSARPVYVPPSSGGPSGSGRSADRPAERTAPAQAPAPPPAQSAPSGGSRGNDSRGSRP